MSQLDFPSFTEKVRHEPYPAISETQPELSAKGKTVVVTGGGKGIGRAIALSFAKAGARTVVVLGRTRTTLVGTKAEIKELGSQSELFVVDIIDVDAMEKAFGEIHARFGKVDVLVNNAAYLNQPGKIAASALDDYWHCFEVNIKGSIITTQAFLKVAAKNATLINISSGAGHVAPIDGFSAYAGSKLALMKVMEYLQAENPTMRVFSINPGRIESDMSSKGDISGMDSIDLPGAFCVWLASPKSEFLKGRMVWSNWDVDEMMSRKAEIVKQDLFKAGLGGWAQFKFSMV